MDQSNGSFVLCFNENAKPVNYYARIFFRANKNDNNTNIMNMLYCSVIVVLYWIET